MLTTLLVFRLHAQEYALPIEQVNEVLRMAALTPIPQSPEWLAGVIDLRGTIIPVIDLRMRLGLAAQALGLNTPIIVARQQDLILGLICDDMVEVLTVSSDAIEPPTDLAGATHSIAALARGGERLILILALESLSQGVPVNVSAMLVEA